MKVDIKEQWVNALRSGEYEQGKEHLRHEGRYCCLGVLTDLAVKAGAGCWDRLDNFREGTEVEAGVLPFAVQEWAELYSENPYLGEATAIGCNDSGVEFDEIADLIKEHL